MSNVLEFVDASVISVVFFLPHHKLTEGRIENTKRKKRIVRYTNKCKCLLLHANTETYQFENK